MQLRWFFLLFCLIVSFSSSVFSASFTIEGGEKAGRQALGEYLQEDENARKYRKSSSSGSYSPKYGCKFCCEGQFGACRSKSFQVNTPYSNKADAQNYVYEEYATMCSKYPFYSGGGSSASVGYATCETWYYNE